MPAGPGTPGSGTTVGSAWVNLGVNPKQFHQGLAMAHSSLARFAAVAAPIAAGIGLALGFKKAVSAAGQFEQAMAMVKAVTLSSIKDVQEQNRQFGLLSDRAKELGRITKWQMTEIAEGMEQLGRAGFAAQEVIAAIAGVSDLAASQMMDLGSAADITAMILRSMRLEAGQAGEVADVLAYAASNSAARVEGLGESYKYVGPLAAAFGERVQETTAMMMKLADAGIRGSMAGTGMRMALSELLGMTSAFRKKLKSTGLDVKKLYDGRGGMKSLTEIFGVFEEAGFGAAEMIELFGKRAGPAMTILLSEGEDAIRSYTQALDEANGTAEDMRKIQEDTLQGQATILSGSWTLLMTTIGEKATPIFKSLVQDNLIPLVNSLVEWAETSPALERWMENVAEGLAGIAKWFIKNGQAILTTLKSIGTALIALMSMKIAMWLNTLALSLAGVVTAMNPVLAGMQAIALAIGVVTFAVRRFNDEQQRVDDARQAIVNRENDRIAAEARRAAAYATMQHAAGPEVEEWRMQVETLAIRRTGEDDPTKGAIEAASTLRESTIRMMDAVREGTMAAIDQYTEFADSERLSIKRDIYDAYVETLLTGTQEGTAEFRRKIAWLIEKYFLSDEEKFAEMAAEWGISRAQIDAEIQAAIDATPTIDKLRDTVASQEGLSAQIKKATEIVQEHGERIMWLTGEMEEEGVASIEMRKTIEALVAEEGAAIKAAKTFGTELENGEQRQKEYEEALKFLEAETTTVSKSFVTLADRMNAFSNVIQRATTFMFGGKAGTVMGELVNIGASRTTWKEAEKAAKKFAEDTQEYADASYAAAQASLAFEVALGSGFMTVLEMARDVFLEIAEIAAEKLRVGLETLRDATWGVAVRFYEAISSIDAFQSALDGVRGYIGRVFDAILTPLQMIGQMFGMFAEAVIESTATVKAETKAREESLNDRNIPTSWREERVRWAAIRPGEKPRTYEDETEETQDQITEELTWIEQLLQQFRGLFQHHIDWFQSFVDRMKDLAERLFPSFMKIIEGPLSTFEYAMDEIATWLEDVFAEDFEAFATAFHEWWTTDVDPFLKEDVFPFLAKAFKAFYEWLGNDFLPFLKNDLWPFFKTELWPIIKDALTAFGQTLKELWDILEAHWPQIKQWLTTELETALAKLNNGLIVGAADILAKSGDLSEAIKLIESTSLSDMEKFVIKAGLAIRDFGEHLKQWARENPVGAIGGGAAGGAMLGLAIGGPLGALIGAIGGAIVGGTIALADGGDIYRSGLAQIHAGETVMQTALARPLMAGVGGGNVTVYLGDEEVTDAVVKNVQRESGRKYGKSHTGRMFRER